MKPSGWVGVDLDGTLAKYDGWKGIDHIGEPVDIMIQKVKLLLEDGVDVRIFTARVACDSSELEQVTKIIEEWCNTHLGLVLPVTNIKDMSMIELWDDRAVQIITNTGLTLYEIQYLSGETEAPSQELQDKEDEWLKSNQQ